MRTEPQSVAKDIEEELGMFRGKVLHKPGKTPLMTNEGPSAWKEAIGDL